MSITIKCIDGVMQAEFEGGFHDAEDLAGEIWRMGTEIRLGLPEHAQVTMERRISEAKKVLEALEGATKEAGP